MARIILGDKKRYDDEVIRIADQAWMRGDDKYLEIVRKPMPEFGMNGDNPTTMEVNGEVIRHHGEHIYITIHMENLVRALGEEPYVAPHFDDKDEY